MTNYNNNLFDAENERKKLRNFFLFDNDPRDKVKSEFKKITKNALFDDVEGYLTIEYTAVNRSQNEQDFHNYLHQQLEEAESIVKELEKLVGFEKDRFNPDYRKSLNHKIIDFLFCFADESELFDGSYVNTEEGNKLLAEFKATDEKCKKSIDDHTISKIFKAEEEEMVN